MGMRIQPSKEAQEATKRREDYGEKSIIRSMGIDSKAAVKNYKLKGLKSKIPKKPAAKKKK